MTTRGIVALIALTAGCSSTTVTNADREAEVAAGGALSTASTVHGAVKTLGAAGTPASSGGSSAVTASQSQPEVGGSAGNTAFSTSIAMHELLGGSASSSTEATVGGSQGSSIPEQPPASGGSDAAGGSASGGSSPRMATAPSSGGSAGSTGVTSVAGAGSVAGAAGSAGAAGLPQYYSEIDGQVHPVTDSPLSVYDYDRFIGVDCASLVARPYDLCEPVDTSLPPGEWKWRAKRVPGNPLISSCISAGDAACGKIHMADVCGKDVLPDGTCGPNPHHEPTCGDRRLGATCWRICLSCTDIAGVNRPPNACKNAQSYLAAADPGMTCPTY